MSTTPTLKRIPLSAIRENPAALRQVNRSEEGYLGLLDSIKKSGVLNAILVRQLPSADGTEIYGIIDGLHRYTGSLDAGHPDIPAQIMNMDDAGTLEAQIIGNVQKIDTKPVEYTKGLQRILASNPLLTMTQLADKLSKSSTWLSERLSLMRLTPSVQKIVDDGKINLSNAYMLAKLPEEEQENFVDRAQSMSPQEFTPTILARKKEIDTAKRQGREAKPAEFVPVPHLRRLVELKGEMDSPKFGPVLCQEAGVTSAPEGFALGVRWVLNMDAKSIEVAREADAVRKKELEQKRAKAAAERAQKRASEAAETAAKLQSEGAGVPAGV